jgi:MFS superfamily sulfate permease-like transporter
VLTGFKAGIAVVVIVDQLPKLLGVHFEKGTVLQNAMRAVQHAPEASAATVILAILLLIIVVGLEHFWPTSPAPLIAVALAIVLSAVIGLDRYGVALVGAVTPGLPRFAAPDLKVALSLWPAACGIALMSFVETIAAGRAFVRSGEPMPTPNRELFAIGLTNLAGSAFSNMPSGGGTSQTAVNSAAGARSQVAGLVTAATVLATLLFLSSIVALMPHAALAAVVVATTAPLFSVPDFAAIRAVRHREFWWAVAAAAGVVMLGTLNGILVTVVISVLTLFYQANRPPVYEVGRRRGTDAFEKVVPGDTRIETVPGLLLLRTEGRVHFANARRIGDQMWALVHETKPRIVVIDMSAVADLEYTALRALTEAEQKLRTMNSTLWLVAMNPHVHAVIKRSPLGKTLGIERMHFTLGDAVEAYNREWRKE